ncbi:MAG: RidA family protein [Maricaulaceae bacterium]
MRRFAVPTLLSAISVLAMSPAADAQSRLERFRSPDLAARGLPLSDLVLTRNWIVLSGRLGVDPNTGQLGDGVQAQTELAVRGVLDQLLLDGSGYDRIVKCTAFLADINDYDAFNVAYKTVFDAAAAAAREEPVYPARTTIGVSGLPNGALVELDCLARRR